MAYITIGDKSWTVETETSHVLDALEHGRAFAGKLDGEDASLIVSPSLAWAEVRPEAPGFYAEVV